MARDAVSKHLILHFPRAQASFTLTGTRMKTDYLVGAQAGELCHTFNSDA